MKNSETKNSGTGRFAMPQSMKPALFHYCPGCGHGTIHRILCEVIDELGIREKTIAVAPVGCAVQAYDYWNFDVCEAAHGRAPAVASGIRRVHPDKTIICYQGDGDLASIGMAETIHAANRAENITVIFVNNNNYGMTGGQLAPTTMIGQKTTTCVNGRAPSQDGYPLKMAELMACIEGVSLSVRTTVADNKHIREAKKYIRSAISMQHNGGGYAFIEILSNCNTNWKMSPAQANTFILEKVTQTFPLGVYKNFPKSS